MNLPQLLDVLRDDAAFRSCATAWRTSPARPPQYAPFPPGLDPRLVEVLQSRGIGQLYQHQTEAVEAVLAGQHVAVVTPTASGKTLCYNLPVLDRLLKEPESRAIYLFPTKALSRDQVAELHEIVGALGVDLKTYTYDGDTSPSARQAIRSAGHIVVTNPDMLHTGILPHHTRWVKLFENLRYVVIDELHQYRGVFGSHLANVLRRLRRIARFYGADPTFICSSATIRNPGELASRLIGAPVRVVDRNGAPQGERHLILYNPPVVNQELGIRRSSLLEARKIGSVLLKNGIQTIFFARSRINVEVLLGYLRESRRSTLGDGGRIRGYRGGYLPSERRAIERGLRTGEVLGVVSTNALELGIDIGQLDAAVLVGYPGSVASAWQQAGRAGRRRGTSLAIMVASSSPLDQYIVRHPEYFFGLSPESGLVNPDNLPILVSHLKCAAFELPFADDEDFGVPTTQEILAYLQEGKILRHAGGRWHWMSDNFPAQEVSLRSASAENFVIIDTTEARAKPRVIGEMDRLAAMTMLHQDAIYLHEGRQYHVDRLDWEEKKAYVTAVDVDYYTDANLAVTIKVLDVLRQSDWPAVTGPEPLAARALGEVLAAAMATIFKKIKLHTHENVGWGKINLPEEQMHTTAYWLSLGPALTDGLSPSAVEAALVGLGNLLANVAPLYLMCDPRDIRPVTQVRSPFTGLPTVYLCDSYPGGIGLADRLYDLDTEVLRAALDLVAGCGCEAGCPSCVGPSNEVGEGAKAGAQRALSELVHRRPPVARS